VRKVPDRAYGIWQRLLVLKWVFNMWLVGLPWCLVLLVIFGWNIYVNIFWNKFWAEGNLFLLGNRLYIITQGLVSLPLMFEIPILLRWIKPFRVLSLITSVIYNSFFIVSIADFFIIGEEERNDVEVDNA
jgi:hypothetical protein